jgi:hypothetical protein
VIKRQDPQRGVIRPFVTDKAQAADDLQPFNDIDWVPQRAVDERLLGSFLASPPKRYDRAHSYLGERIFECLDQTLGIGFLLPLTQRGMAMGADSGTGWDLAITFWTKRQLFHQGLPCPATAT